MTSRRVGLASWGVTELELLLKHYGVQKYMVGKILPPLVNSDACKREFFISNCKEWYIGMRKHLETFGPW